MNTLYIVTEYGCNSTPSDMFTPYSKLFTQYNDAYAYFLSISPSLDSEDQNAYQYINPDYKKDDNSKEYTIIEERKQIGGFHYGNENCAKRPFGALIARYKL